MNDFDSELREQSITSQIDIVSNQSSVLVVTKNHELFTKKLAAKECTIEIAETKNDADYELTFDFENIESKKFQVILLDDTINHVSNPIEFIKQINGFLAPDGFLLCTANNLFNSVNRLRFLNGDSQIINSILKNRNLEFSSLDSILLTLAESDLSIGKIIRVEEEISLKSKLDLNTFTFTEELLKALTSDSESNTFYYVFTVTRKPAVNQSTRRWISKFSKNLVTEEFKQILIDLRLQYEKHINYLKQTNREQYVSIIADDRLNDEEKGSVDHALKRKSQRNILPTEEEMLKNELNQDILEDSKKFLKKSLKEKDEYLGNALKEKDEYLKSAMQETDEYVKNALKDKDEVIEAMQNSFALRLCSKLDKLLGRKHKK
tara:strand:+ start:744 stop:1874 length:1131 start_codon:yes stop_codon:yes gene_type:complete